MLRLNVSRDLSRYGFAPPHPFGTDRQDVFWREFERRGLADRVELHAGRRATVDELMLFHTAEYLGKTERQCNIGFGYLDQGDTPASRGLFDAARSVVGSALDAVEAMLDGDVRRCFQPIGGLHHGRRDAASGFCILDDCGVVIEYLKRRGISPIAYVDIDAHHGDGVYYGFESDPEVIIADIHEDGRHLYPGTGSAEERGTGKAVGTKLNLPLEPGAGDAAFADAFDAACRHLERFQPAFFVLQAGADSIAGDPLTHLQLSADCHRQACSRLVTYADQWSDGRLLVLGGGGYSRENIADTWCQITDELSHYR